MEQTGKLPLHRTENEYLAAFCILQKSLTGLTGSLSLLHKNELQYYHTLQYPKRKQSYLLGRVAAKKAIVELFPQYDPAAIFIDTGVFSFPIVKALGLSNLKICITHCDDIGMAIAYPEAHPIGVDIEKVNPARSAVIAGILSAGEKQLINLLPLSPDISSCSFWTIKEALSKIFMTGFTLNPEMLAIKTFDKAEHLYVSTFEHTMQYKAVTSFFQSYVCSIVLPGKTTLDLSQFTHALNRIT
jgi:4'-phosphopantetheinyl transferase